jgi:hypothetical protein
VAERRPVVDLVEINRTVTGAATGERFFYTVTVWVGSRMLCEVECVSLWGALDYVQRNYGDGLLTSADFKGVK